MKVYQALTLLALIGAVMADPTPNGAQVDDLMNQMEIDEGFSQAANEGGEDETANMSEDQLYFRDYCLNAQGTIKNFVAEKLNGAAANVYSVMLTSATDIGREVLAAQKKEVEQGTKLIEQAARESENSTPEEAEEAIQSSGIFARVSAAVKGVITAIIETAKATLFSRIQELKDHFGTEGLRERIEEACSSISNELQPRLTKQLTEAKASIKSAASGKDLTAVLTTARVDNIGCTLTSRISKVAKFCDILKVAGPAVYQLVGIN